MAACIDMEQIHFVSAAITKQTIVWTQNWNDNDVKYALNCKTF